MHDTGYNLSQRSEALSHRPTDQGTEEVREEFRIWIKWAMDRKSKGLETEQRIF